MEGAPAGNEIAPDSSEAIARAVVAGLKRQLDQRYQDFTEGLTVDAASLDALAAQFSAAIGVVQDARAVDAKRQAA